jgi:hypothetical protein
MHYHSHTIPPLDPAQSQINPVHVLKLYFFQLHFNAIRLSTPRYTKCFFRFSDSNFLSIYGLPMRATYLAHIILHSILIISEEQCKL